MPWKQCLRNSCRPITITTSILLEVQPVLKALGQRIRELRSEQGYSQESFADHCGVHRTFMGTIERGESNLSFSNLVKVAEGLGITLAQLLSGLEKKAAQSAKERSSRT
jgi:transcriptional regulator with XRE-family HTH domain